MKSQKQLIEQKDWDILIILDACRYDFFEKNYEDFLEGKLHNTESEGSNSPEWVQNTFPDNYTYKYISANPFVNSYSSDLDIYGDYNPSKHFDEIKDVWKTHWDLDKNIVTPEALSKVAKEEIEKEPSKNTIIHYMQPHAPYLGLELEFDGEKPEAGFNFSFMKKIEEKVGDELTHLLVKLGRLTNRRLVYELIKPVWGRATGPGSTAIRFGREKLHESYEQNLRIVLREVSEIVKEHPEKKIAITADHGELLGENRKYGHPYNSENPNLITVPWFENEE